MYYLYVVIVVVVIVVVVIPPQIAASAFLNHISQKSKMSMLLRKGPCHEMGADPPISGALFRVRRPFDLKWAVRLGGRPFHEMGGVITRAVRTRCKGCQGLQVFRTRCKYYNAVIK
jgi:hypothetical protein